MSKTIKIQSTKNGFKVVASSRDIENSKDFLNLKSEYKTDLKLLNIDVLDENANLLTKDINNEQNGQVSSEEISKQQEAEKSAENNLKKKIMDILEPTIGDRKSVV